MTEEVKAAEAKPDEQVKPDGGEQVEQTQGAELQTEQTEQTTESPEAIAAAETEKRNKRYEDLTRREQAALRRAEEAEAIAARALELAAGKAPADEPKPAEDAKPVAPKFADFNDPERFAEAMTQHSEALAAWTVRKELAEHSTKQTKADAEQKQRAEAERIEKEYVEVHRAKALKELPDYVEIAETAATITPVMAFAIKARGAMGPRIAYYLGQNAEEGRRIAQLPPQMQVMEIGVLSGRLESAAKQTKPLPAPIKPTGAATSVTKTLKEVGDSDEPGSMEKYASMRAAEDKSIRIGR